MLTIFDKNCVYSEIFFIPKLSRTTYTATNLARNTFGAPCDIHILYNVAYEKYYIIHKLR